MELSNEFILKDSLKRIKEIYSVANELYKNEEYEKAFRILNSGSTFLGILNALDQFNFLIWKINFLGIQYNICFNQNKPDYNNYLFYFTSSLCYEVIHQLAQFPTNQNFFRWKEQFKNRPSDFFRFKDNSEFDKALSELELIKHKDKILKRIYNFCFNELPLIYRIKPEYLNPIELNKYFNEKVTELLDLTKEFELISTNDLSLVIVKIGDSVREIYDIKTD